MADVKPETGFGKPTTKGAQAATTAEPLTPLGPNETEDGIIKAPPPTPPGPDQMGLVGGDPGESIQSTAPYEGEEATGAQKAAKAKAVDKHSDR